MNEFVDILLAFATIWVAMAMPIKSDLHAREPALPANSRVLTREGIPPGWHLDRSQHPGEQSRQ